MKLSKPVGANIDKGYVVCRAAPELIYQSLIIS